MRAGRLRHRIKIQQIDNAVDDFGSPTQSYVTFKDNVSASVEPINGREYFSAAQVEANVSTNIHMRYLAGVTPDMRIIFQNRVYEIISVINVGERNRWLECKCNEFVGDAP
jgi:SPP1 family predicted phage head-tail adaptor